MTEADRRQIQSALLRLVIMTCRSTACSAPDTRAAIRRFQHEIGADMSGTITPPQSAGCWVISTDGAAWQWATQGQDRGARDGAKGEVQPGDAGRFLIGLRPGGRAVLAGWLQDSARRKCCRRPQIMIGQATTISRTTPTMKSLPCWPTSSRCASCRRPSRSGRRRQISARCSSSFPITASARRRPTRPTRRTARPTGRPTSSTCSAATRR